MEIDSKDKQILGLLDRNARIPINEIAKRTRLNKDVVRYRIKKLEQEKVIEGYHTVVDAHKLGFLTIRIYFDLININSTIEKNFIHFLDKEFKASQIFRIDGIYSLGIITWEKSIYELENKLIILKENFGKYIEKYELSIFTEFQTFFRKYLFNLNKDTLTLKKADEIEIDEIDYKILKLLSDNARLTSINISEKISIPQKTVFNRIKALEKKKIILGYRVNLNIGLLKYENYFLEIFLESPKEVKQIELFARNNINSIGIDYVLHGADIEIETEFSNKDELLSFLQELKNQFKHVRKIRYWSTLNY